MEGEAEAGFHAQLRSAQQAIHAAQLQELCKVLDKAEVLLYSEGIAAADRERLLVKVVGSVQEGVEQALRRHGLDASIAVVPKGPYVLTRLRGAA